LQEYDNINDKTKRNAAKEFHGGCRAGVFSSIAKKRRLWRDAKAFSMLAH
jgi:hypothetical protein